MLYRISVTERGLTGIANIFRSRLSRLDDLLGAGTVPLSECQKKCWALGICWHFGRKRFLKLGWMLSMLKVFNSWYKLFANEGYVMDVYFSSKHINNNAVKQIVNKEIKSSVKDNKQY